MTKSPSPNGSNGRNRSGRFTVGNKGGPGNPHAQAVGRFRSALLEAVTDEDFAAVVRVLVEKATAGDLAAIKVFLDYTIGRPGVADDGSAGPVTIRIVEDENWNRRGPG